MALAILNLSPSTLEIRVQGTVDAEDCTTFVPATEHLIDQCGKINLLIDVSDLRGATPRALWEDLKFDVGHYDNVHRVALVGADDSNTHHAGVSGQKSGINSVATIHMMMFKGAPTFTKSLKR
jgi:hypothetical protein